MRLSKLKRNLIHHHPSILYRLNYAVQRLFFASLCTPTGKGTVYVHKNRADEKNSTARNGYTNTLSNIFGSRIHLEQSWCRQETLGTNSLKHLSFTMTKITDQLFGLTGANASYLLPSLCPSLHHTCPLATVFLYIDINSLKNLVIPNLTQLPRPEFSNFRPSGN